MTASLSVEKSCAAYVATMSCSGFERTDTLQVNPLVQSLRGGCYVSMS